MNSIPLNRDGMNLSRSFFLSYILTSKCLESFVFWTLRYLVLTSWMYRSTR